MNDNLKLSKEGRNLIKSFERFEPVSYRCPAGKWTIGYGHTQGVQQGQTCTKEQAEKWLDHDIQDAEKIIKRHVTVALTQGQYDALVSFVFNVGAGVEGGKSGFITLRDGRQSTLLGYVNQGRFTNAAAEILKWVRAGGLVLGGLLRRRQAEKDMFCGLTYKNRKT